LCALMPREHTACTYVRFDTVAPPPEIYPLSLHDALPIFTINGAYTGASAETVAETVVAPIEQQVNGVEGMLYMSSNSTADGRFSDRKSTRLNSSHSQISYAVFCLKKKKKDK